MTPTVRQTPFMNAFYAILQWAMSRQVHVIFHALKTTIRVDPSGTIWTSRDTKNPEHVMHAQRVELIEQIQGTFGQAQTFHLYTGSATDPELIDRDALLVRIGSP